MQIRYVNKTNSYPSCTLYVCGGEQLRREMRKAQFIEPTESEVNEEERNRKRNERTNTSHEILNGDKRVTIIHWQLCGFVCDV